MLSDSARSRCFKKVGVLKLFFSCILTEIERSEVPKFGNSSGRKSSNIIESRNELAINVWNCSSNFWNQTNCDGFEKCFKAISSKKHAKYHLF
jgi:hypothetical protein